MGLCDLPRDLLALALQFADLASLLRLEAVNRHVRDTIVQCDTWRVLAQRMALYASGCTARSSSGWKRLAMMTQSPVGEELSVLRRVRDCSSVDHSNESAENTLTRSHCGIGVALLSTTVVADDPIAFEAIAKRLQVECGCARSRPCYWSSASTWGYSTTDHLDYALWENCLVNSVQVVPYRVFWYPGSPTYSPKRVSFALYELGDNGDIGTLVYESMVFSIVKDMKMHTFELPARVFLSRGVLRLNLFDRQEDIGVDVARWMQENNLPPYYTCLSYVGATGLLESASAYE
ncbi:putative F-box protein [Phytophthora cinnamomi]|uniref:putative F-box protein n=1 Tax=Phytophthora cinnamomi TaxID=4785 RepID=UPI003559DCFB|nr:putative F-box protein [Phytophthora cinnamomi]